MGLFKFLSKINENVSVVDSLAELSISKTFNVDDFYTYFEGSMKLFELNLRVSPLKEEGTVVKLIRRFHILELSSIIFS